MGETAPKPKYEFAKGRQTTEAALEQLVEATGAAPEELLAAIRPLQMPNLGLGVRWASELWEPGSANAIAADKYILVLVSAQNVAGEEQDISSVQHSHLIELGADSLAYQSFDHFNGAHYWLMDNVATAQNPTPIDWSATVLGSPEPEV